MSDPGYAAVQYQGEPPAAPKPDVPRWVLVAAGAVAVIGAVLVAFVVMGELKDDEPGKKYPSAWDPRVAPYVKIVEKERGLVFMHPVEVRFLDGAAFNKEVTTDEKELDEDDRKEIEQTTGLLRAIGLLTGDVDLFEAFNDASGGGTLAFYSFEDERITIRGKALNPASRATLVHELTHALQDQHFAIGKRTKELEKKDSADSESSVLDAIIEGDAERVAGLYRESLNAKQSKALKASEDAQRTKASAELKNIPKVVLTLISSPYVLGESLMQTVSEKGGNKAVDKLYRDTPTHDAALYDPFQVLAGDLDADEVETPALEDGEKEIDAGEFGALSWYFMLAERVPVKKALDVVDGWGGDSYVFFERKGLACVRAAYRGDDDADSTRMLSALQQWIAAAPGTPAKVTSNDGVVAFESCDPGKASRVGGDRSVDALGLLSARNQIGEVLLSSGVPEGPAGCIAGRVVREYTLAQLSDPKFGTDDTSVQTRIQQFALACR